MKLEIICPNGIGRETEVYADGQRVTGIKRLIIDIPIELGTATLNRTIDELATVTIERYLMDDKNIQLDPATREPISEVLRFTGENFALTKQKFIPQPQETFD